MKLREDPFRKKLLDAIHNKKRYTRSIDTTPYDIVLQKIGSPKHKQFSRFEAFLKFEMEDKEVVQKDQTYLVQHKDEFLNHLHYSKPGEWITEKVKVEDKL